MRTIEEIDIQERERAFQDAYPQDILRWAAQTFEQHLTIVTSFGPTGLVTLHMMSEIAPHTPVLTLDTGLLFPETYALMDEVERLLGLNLIRVRPSLSLEAQAADYGEALWESDPDQCCMLRKTIPLGEALDGCTAWIAGVRRDQSPQRAQVPIIAWDTRYQRIKLNPFAAWTEDMVWTYIRAHGLPYNPLHAQGYPSIGCLTCTRAVSGSGYSREGRWSGSDKMECGIHLNPSDTPQQQAAR